MDPTAKIMKFHDRENFQYYGTHIVNTTDTGETAYVGNTTKCWESAHIVVNYTKCHFKGLGTTEKVKKQVE